MRNLMVMTRYSRPVSFITGTTMLARNTMRAMNHWRISASFTTPSQTVLSEYAP